MALPFPGKPSPIIHSIEWTSDLWTLDDPGIMGDTYPTSWAPDDTLFTSAGDPNYGPSYDGLDVSILHGLPPNATIEQINPMPHLIGSGGQGAKPSGILALGGQLILAVQNTLGYQPPAWGRDCQHGSDASLISSKDGGITWSDLPAKPHFPGSRFGGPSFIQYGKGDENIKDGFVYAISGDQWDNGCHLRLGRAPAESILDIKSWSFFTGYQPNGQPLWEPWLHAAVPILSLPNCLGLPEMVYLPAIQRYLLLTWAFPVEFDTVWGGDLIVYESEFPWGPFNFVQYDREWLAREVAPYCPRLPLKWMDSDGLGGWILTSGNYNPPADPTRPFYKPNAVAFRLKLR
ncbi:MAG: DUF4185 domain-containing protein [Fimbriimonadaceae bacterium]|jgi:hypothetical protein|nr:DUF4185 domain-containing protein [Fimbriimonadaceae bacterium]